MDLISNDAPLGREDRLVVQAFELLAMLEPHDVPTLDTIRVTTLSAGVEASTVGGIITINRAGEFYTNGDVLGVACLIHHEFQHMAKHANECDAYAASFAFCRRHLVPFRITQRVIDEWRRHTRVASARVRSGLNPSTAQSPSANKR